MSVTTPLTRLLGVKYPIILAGMYIAGCAELAAAVSNAGGLGVIGAIHFTPDQLRSTLSELKSRLDHPSLPFGVNLLLPQVGGSARKTNYDLTRGTLDELIEIVVTSGTRLFISAVGVAPKEVIDKLHANGIFYMNMSGHPKHVLKACAAGADIICAQGSEAAGHISEIPTSVLVPTCADLIKDYTSPLTGQPVQLVAAGGICDGRSIAACLMYGASAVWVGTRFVTAKESAAPNSAKQTILNAGFDDTIKTTYFTGRPLRTAATPYLREWETTRLEEQKQLLAHGIVPNHFDIEHHKARGGMPKYIQEGSKMEPMSIAAGRITTCHQTAAEIIDEMMGETLERLMSVRDLVTPSRENEMANDTARS